MINAYLSVFIDFIVLIFLATTIFYVLKLSKALNGFKAQRREFDDVVTNMISSIGQAERTVSALKQTGAQEVSELEKLVHEAKILADELKIINEASESMAKRLENLAETNRKIVQPSHDNKFASKRRTKKANDFTRKRHSDSQDDGLDNKISSPVNRESLTKSDNDYGSTLRKVDPKQDKKSTDFKPQDKLPSFMIKDKEFQEEYDEDDMSDTLQSEAEKELFAALKGSKRTLGKG